MTSKRLRLFGTSLVIALFAGGIANATVTQVDGTIIPEDNELQAALNAQGETLNAILDAAELPEVFLPNLTQPVVFTNVAEGAGFENSFGWYNIGDDITSDLGRRQNLHPILGCGSRMENHAFDPGNPNSHLDHHHGNPTFYIRTSEPGGNTSQISVNFAAEQTAGRYKGGFIAFYLITPEGTNSSCGDFLSANPTLRGFIYFTQKDLNNDGDFVHHLVYNSDSAADRFYFGFEDLFRGGDNDFEDMLIRVDGLTPPCVPTVEVCDGRDNDCDGQIDAADPDTVGVGEPCLCDNDALTCSDGVVVGQCQTGQTICVSGEIQCDSVVGPSPETCDGLDNNCNNIVDDNPAGIGDDCDGADSDFCAEGETTCVGGQVVCGDDTGPNVELCNNVDDDCDGTTDEDPIDQGAPCGTDLGVCTPGIEVCVNGTLDCQGAVEGTPEVCDGLDNDCDGIPDDNPGDINVPCGGTDVGECQPGLAVCSGGTVVCVNERGPLPEVCDTRDNDCDGQTDEDALDVGAPCNAPGLCSPGVIVCTPNGPECQGGTPGTPEVCNGIDDDCNGIIDDDPSDVGGPCGGGDGICQAGTNQCINGTLTCVGGVGGTTETCNGIDDNCDGIIDEGDLCEGGECANGQCSSPCAAGEFPCPIGQRCNEGYCIIDPCFDMDCPAGENGERNVCRDGECVPICETTAACPGDTVCRPTDGFCVPNSCHYLPLCAEDELCKQAACVPDLCADKTCPGDQFCRDGECIASCADVSCGAGEVCRDGACQPSGCSRDCPTNQVCNGTICVVDPCLSRTCPLGEVCEPTTGECVSDPCIGVDCPQGQMCDFGDCVTDTSQPKPAPDRVSAGGGGCSATPGQSDATGALAWMALALAVLVISTRRPRLARQQARQLIRHQVRQRLAAGLRVGGMLVGLAGALFGLGSCNVNPFCLNCETNTDGGIPTVDGGDGLDDAGPDDSDGGGEDCEMGIGRPEECDGRDNDCDGEIDEDFNLDSDVLNCGACGADCIRPGARTACNQAQCEFVECFPGYLDIDEDTGGSFEQTNGCEYSCFLSNDGVEACDRLDNNCNGTVDEGIDLSTNENCGACGQVCSRFQASASCESGVCRFDPATDCNPGFHDSNGNQSDGCEYACTASNGGVESCDLRDNDCDGNVDEDTNLQSDVQNCGACGRVCSFLNASASCTSGQCVFNPATDCNPGFHDINNNPIDGCEYACTRSNGGVEVCDQVDNDCNGVIDNNPVGAGASCNAAPGGTPVGACTNTGTTICSLGTLVCVGAPGPQAETCDAIDNDCDGTVDDGVTRSCYTGPAGTQGVGVCTGGTQICVNGSFTGACVGEVTPADSEECNTFDDDCNGLIDDAAGGGPLTQTCYSGTPGTPGQGTCEEGTTTCTFGIFGPCVGEVTDAPDLCGDGLDTDCDSISDAGEGCLVMVPGELRLDAGNTGDPLASNPGQNHSVDLSVALGGSPVGSRVYAVWADLRNGQSDIFLRRSTDGGATWTNIQNLTAGNGGDGRNALAAVKPLIVVGPGDTDVVYVVYQTVDEGVRDIQVQRSTNSGANFTLFGSALDASGDAFHHHAAVNASGTTLAVVWESLSTSTLARRIQSRVSTDSGATFAAERTINVNSGTNPIAGRPQVGITSAGRFVWVWRETRANATTDIFATSSTSATTPIDAAAERRLDNDTGGTRNSDFPQLAVAAQNVYVTWQDISTQPNGGSDVMFARSVTNGIDYQAERIIDDPAAERSASFTPVLAVDPRTSSATDDRVLIAWEDRREGTQIFAAASSNSGSSFAGAVRASSSNGAPISGVTRDPRIAHAGGNSFVIAYVNDQGTGVRRIFATSTIDAGLSWQLTHDVVDLGTGEALQPVVVPGTGGANGRALIFWIDFRAGTRINGDTFVRRMGQ